MAKPVIIAIIAIITGHCGVSLVFVYTPHHIAVNQSINQSIDALCKINILLNRKNDPFGLCNAVPAYNPMDA